MTMSDEFKHILTITFPTEHRTRKKRRMIRGYGGKKMDHNMNHPMFEDKDIEDACRQAAKAVNKMLGDTVIHEENIKKVSKQIKKEQGIKNVEEAIKEAAEVITGVANAVNADKEKIRVNLDKSCLEEAAKIIHGNRQDDYGTPEDSFQRIADYWNAYLCHNSVTDVEHSLYAKDVAMMMVLFKIARLEHAYTHDSCVDICGYTAIYDNMYKD